MWQTDSVLKQLPYMTSEIIDNLKDKARVEDIADFMNMSDEDREALVPFD
eukprot:CAMPEP_0170506526 /NCGR_PEP_ID=MMETSP0208-20121228/55208_1 /TAXON_ID=197538 /ORGANISM="Strombidium inclinatum, Strain S3" /LENGTH=49 /DNA_ID=CAMNT_0010788101 /DNA_START=420 /DNA_END=569 /DNA_ORIENTATION=-